MVLIGILFYLSVTHFDGLHARLSMILDVLAPFLAGFAIAYLLNTPMGFFENKVFYRLRFKRGLAILTVYLLALVLVVVLLNLVLPQVVSSVVVLVGNLEGYMNNLNTLVDHLVERFQLEGDGIEAFMLSYQDLMNQAAKLISQEIPEILNFGVALGSGIISAITAIISSIYMLSGKCSLVAQIKMTMYAVFPKAKADRALDIFRRANDIFAGFINGMIINSAIIGVLCFITCTILQIPFAVLISVVVGVTNVIPFFGPFIGAIPSLMILLIVDPWAALRFGILILAMQQFDGNILSPKILGNSTGISAIWVLVAIVVGGGLFGPIGMLLGVPTFAVFYMLMREFVTSRLAAKGLDREGNPVGPQQQADAEESSPQ